MAIQIATKILFKVGELAVNLVAVMTAIAVTWFVFIFSPLNITESAFAGYSDRSFVFVNWSEKTHWGLVLCGPPDDSFLTFQDATAETYRVEDDATKGTGGLHVSRFEVRSNIPEMALGPARVRKTISYPCIFGTHKIVHTRWHSFDYPPQSTNEGKSIF